MKIEAFDHIHIYSKNPQESADFYVNNFQAEEVYKKEGYGGTRVYLALGGQIIVLGPLPADRVVTESGQDSHKHHHGLDHFGIRVKNLDVAIKELKDQGVEIIAEPVKGSSGVSYAFIKAPDGVIIELTQYGFLPKVYLKHKKVL